MRRIIFHIPNKIDENFPSGSQIRPIQMLNAFRNLGYEVDVVMGYVADRKKQIRCIKQHIKNGVKYDFLYSESSTMPTALTETHHLPVAPFLDFSFFKFCKKHGIKIGLFYRDVYWVFKKYEQDVPFFKRIVSLFFYKYDLKKYSNLLNVLYLPSKKMFQYVPMQENDINVISLPPAVKEKLKVTPKNLEFIYVGGIGAIYDLRLFSLVVTRFTGLTFNLCTRKLEWKGNKTQYNEFNIKIYHKNDNELKEVYDKSSIAVYFLKPDKLWDFAVGVKLFEYISYYKPIIAVQGTAVGNFVAQNDIGWSIPYSEEALQLLINDLIQNPKQIEEKIKNIEKILPENTWEARAKQVKNDLS